MTALLDRDTILIILSAFVMALLCILPESRAVFPFWVIAAGAQIADTLFHEMGHTVFYWLFGQPAIPMIFTLFSADQAGGMSMAWERSWLVQIAAFAALAYGCVWVRQNEPRLLIPAMVFSLAIFAVALGSHYNIVIAYMGPGGAIAMGGFFLFRAWIYLDARNGYERWLNAFLGFFLTINNFYFSYALVFDPFAREVYSDHVAFGVTHNDFWIIAEDMGWKMQSIAIFTMGYCIVTIAVSFIAAVWMRDDFFENPNVVE